MCGSLPVAPAHYQHVVWIWFENKSAASVVGSPSAPYFNGLSAKCALATNFHNLSHPSLPNYLGATSGRTNGVTTDCSPAGCPDSLPSVFRQLESAGKTWKGYAESMPRNCTTYGVGTYAPRHNPAVYYTDVKPTCPSNDVPLESHLAQDLDSNALPSFSFITPDLCNDMHDCSISTGDAWLKKWLTKIVTSRAYRTGLTVVFVTFDEGTGGTHGEDCASPTNHDSSCNIATWVVGASVKPGAKVATRFTHYSMLRTTEQLLGLKSYLGNAATAASMRAAFHI